MKRPHIIHAPLLLPLLLIFNFNLSANEHTHTHDNHAANEHAHSHSNPREAIDHMHHKLDDDQAPFKAKEAQALKELNEMTIREDVRIEDIYGKIDELMAAQTQIMRLRYEHLVEMRKVLTDEQRIKYDQNVLKRSEVR